MLKNIQIFLQMLLFKDSDRIIYYEFLYPKKGFLNLFIACNNTFIIHYAKKIIRYCAL